MRSQLYQLIQWRLCRWGIFPNDMAYDGRNDPFYQYYKCQWTERWLVILNKLKKRWYEFSGVPLQTFFHNQCLYHKASCRTTYSKSTNHQNTLTLHRCNSIVTPRDLGKITSCFINNLVIFIEDERIWPK